MIINECYKIESDFLNVILYCKQKARKDSQGENWRALAYFSSPRNALHYLINREITGTGMEDFKTVCAKIAELEGLVGALEGLPELLQSAPRIGKEVFNATGRVRVV